MNDRYGGYEKNPFVINEPSIAQFLFAGSKEKQYGPLVESDKKTNNTGTEDILLPITSCSCVYTRDSIMRQILSEELEDFCISYASQYNCICLDWNIPINLNHDEITEILSNYAEYGRRLNFSNQGK